MQEHEKSTNDEINSEKHGQETLALVEDKIEKESSHQIFESLATDDLNEN